ncbi:MAG TPA: ROK family protein [Acidimicrobiales bacterium]|nr:ROK family protein [Acidimicrobiales bacterium]
MVTVDIGGTKLESAIVGPDGSISGRHRHATGGTDAEVLFGRLVGTIDRTLDEHGRTQRGEPGAIGVGCGGPMAAGGVTVSPLNIPQWRDFPLRERLAERFELPVWVDNDAKALALGEGWLGAAIGVRNYLAMVVSTGVGAGLVVDGRLLDGASGNAGHIGHIVVEPDGRRCACGSRGCLEAEASGTSIAAITGRPAIEADVAMRRRCGALVGRAVAALVVALDLRLACVGGSVALGFGDTFFAAANAELARTACLDYAREARIVPVGLGDEGPLIGAACVARRMLVA